jgi:ubiquinone/menaquinone biosynthesis C-methylase UbiE
MPSEFDQFSSSYNEYLNDSLNLLGSKKDFFTDYKSKLIKNFLMKRKLLDTKLSILDFGCGIGNNIPSLSKNLPLCRMHGTDVSSESIKIANDLYSNICTFKYFDGGSLPFENDYFDLVFISNVFHHIPFENHVRTLKVIKKVIKKGGIIFIIEHNPLNPLTKFVFNNCIFDKEAKMLKTNYLVSILQREDFKSPKLNYILFIPPFLRIISFFDKYLSFIPFGAQYCITAYK